MKKLVIFLVVIAICFTVGLTNSEAAGKTQDRFVGLHDRILPIQDVRVIDGDTKVPLKEIANFLYIPIEESDGMTIIKKSGFEITYDPNTKIATKDGVTLTWSPIIDEDGTLYISVKYIAREMGFEMHYFRDLQTLRIYRDTYQHISHEEYEKKVRQSIDKKPAPKPAQKATVYLTFDDGPNEFTTINNATLKKYNVKGSFFFLGKHMKIHEEIVAAVAADGHYIGSHSMTHDKNKVYKSTKAFIDEMSEAAAIIEKITGKEAKLVRVPYGSKPHVTPAMQKQISQLGYKMWDWNVDSNDWQYTDKQSNQIIENVKAGVQKSYKAGNRNIVILMHDRNQTTKALPEIIEWLQKEGYIIETYQPDNHVTQNFLHDTSL